MTLGTGITLIVIGLIFLLGVIQVDIPFIDEYALGVLLVLAGIATIVLLFTWGRSHGRSTTYVQRGGGTRVVERRVVRDTDDPLL
ncbi:MAG TPA: hypothetical protein VM093_05580 [Aeromicrobium sp.]|nr:hypothetical protein [Aeromicrobium sp.]